MTNKKEARDQLASPHLTFNKLTFQHADDDTADAHPQWVISPLISPHGEIICTLTFIFPFSRQNS